MAIYDCFQYFNEDHMVDLRLHILDKYVDFFVISESTKTHQGKPKKINFGNGTLWKYAQTVGPAYLGAPTHPGGKNEVKVYADI